MRGLDIPDSAMCAKQTALLRCENLDLFAGPLSVRETPAVAPAASREAEGTDCGLLFRIGPEDQLDLFRHSSAEIATGAIRRALKDLDSDKLRAPLAVLRGLPAYVQFVVDTGCCRELIERLDARWGDAALAVPWIESELWPAATRCLARDAMVLIRPALLGLLERAAAHPRCARDCRHAHPSYLWQLLGEPARAVLALEGDASWSLDAATLSWHAQLSEQAQMHKRVLTDIAELCLAFPDEAESWLANSRSWAEHWSKWCDLDDALPIHAFPAWCRLTRATEFPSPDPMDPRPGAQLLRIAEQLARRPAETSLRKSLHSLSPPLLATFLASRATASA